MCRGTGPLQFSNHVVQNSDSDGRDLDHLSLCYISDRAPGDLLRACAGQASPSTLEFTPRMHVIVHRTVTCLPVSCSQRVQNRTTHDTNTNKCCLPDVQASTSTRCNLQAGLALLCRVLHARASVRHAQVHLHTSLICNQVHTNRPRPLRALPLFRSPLLRTVRGVRLLAPLTLPNTVTRCLHLLLS